MFSWVRLNADWNACVQPYLTELDLRNALLPQESIDYLTQAMPQTQIDGLEEDAFDYDSYLTNVSTNPGHVSETCGD